MADKSLVPKQNPVRDVKKHLRTISLTPTLSKIADRRVTYNQFGCVLESSTMHTCPYNYQYDLRCSFLNF